MRAFHLLFVYYNVLQRVRERGVLVMDNKTGSQ